MSYLVKDHEGNEVTHGRALVNGVRLHYMKAGSGDPVFLLHGVPKTSYHWRHIIPLLTPYYTVIAPDLRGLGDS
ncbi:MAG TPA: alpha/beta fold hydrolase, partial [Cyanophyceae cyanobacterium]